MNETLFELQQKQLEHDKKCHRDIFFLSHQDRFKHIALHYGKYSKRLADIILTPEITVKECKKIVKKTLVDTMIMILNSGELLQINFEQEFKSRLDLKGSIYVQSLQLFLKEKNKDLYQFLSNGTYKDMTMSLMLEMVSISGFMQKSAEELDHMMGMPREQIRNQTIEFLYLILLAGSIWDVVFTIELDNRWNEIQDKVIL